MNIHEAMMARTKERPFITRESWEKIVVFMEMDKGIYIQPTDTPEGCLFYGPAKKVRAVGGSQQQRTLSQQTGKRQREVDTK